MKNNENGITLVALIVIIIVLLILATITINSAINGIDDTSDDTALVELKTVQHAILQRDSKYKLTKNIDVLVGNRVTTLPTLPNSLTWKMSSAEQEDPEKAYYELNKEDLKELGLEPGTGSYADTYIVNYYSGEVYNRTRQQVKDGSALYITSK